MNLSKSRPRKTDDWEENSGPTEEEARVQALLRKQLNTSIEGTLSHVKAFHAATTYIPVASSRAGTRQLHEYKQLQRDEERLAQFRLCGLTEEEIRLKLDQDADHESEPATKRQKVAPDALRTRVEMIEKKLSSGIKCSDESKAEQRSSEDQSSVKVLTRTAATFSVEGPASSLFVQQWKPPEDLMQLGKDSEKVVEKDCEVHSSSLQERKNLSGKVSLLPEWEPVVPPSLPVVAAKARPRPPKIQPLTREQITSNRLAFAAIKALPRFVNYTEGNPSQVLFVKNLSPHTTQADLVEIFALFQEEGKAPIRFRMMEGRMKGQAFVTFPSVDKAKEALHLVNGYQLKGKPLIIQYGRHGSVKNS